MNAATLLDSLRCHGIILTMVGGNIRYEPTPDPATLKEMRQHKAELLLLLATPPEAIEALEEKPAPSPLEKFDDPNELTDAEVTRQFLNLANHGTIPSFCTKAVICAGCGPVWEREYVDPNPETCCWCYRRSQGLPIPRPGVACHPPALPGVEIPELLTTDARP